MGRGGADGPGAGTQVSITAMHPCQETARSAAAAALDEIELVEDLLSIYRPDSQLSRLNQNGTHEDRTRTCAGPRGRSRDVRLAVRRVRRDG